MESDVDYRQNPHLYKVGRGQQGVLIVSPISQRYALTGDFKTPPEAEISSQTILKMFYNFLDINDFVGADMAKKYLHMGFTRARRYANHRDGKKYNDDGTIIPQEPDALTCDKATSARIFYACWKQAREDKKYLTLKKNHKKMYE